MSLVDPIRKFLLIALGIWLMLSGIASWQVARQMWRLQDNFLGLIRAIHETDFAVQAGFNARLVAEAAQQHNDQMAGRLARQWDQVVVEYARLHEAVKLIAGWMSTINETLARIEKRLPRKGVPQA